MTIALHYNSSPVDTIIVRRRYWHDETIDRIRRHGPVRCTVPTPAPRVAVLASRVQRADTKRRRFIQRLRAGR